MQQWLNALNIGIITHHTAE